MFIINKCFSECDKNNRCKDKANILKTRNIMIFLLNFTQFDAIIAYSETIFAYSETTQWQGKPSESKKQRSGRML